MQVLPVSSLAVINEVDKVSKLTGALEQKKVDCKPHQTSGTGLAAPSPEQGEP